jgi:hypothetical protein
MTNITAARIITGFGVACAIVGCANSAGLQTIRVAAPVIGRAPSTPTSYLSAIANLPWRPYIQSPHQVLVFQKAQLILVVQCMHRHGFTAFKQSMMSYGEPDLAQEPGGPYGWINIHKAMKYGFHPSPADRVTYHVASTRLSAVENGALRTCLNEANAKLTGKRTIDPENLVNQLAAQAWDLTVNDTRVHAATVKWSSCMRAQGFRYSTPPSQVWWIRRSESASPAEIATASSDAACTATSDLAGIFFAVDAGYQQELIRQEAFRLAAIGNSLRAENARAVVIVDNGK